MGLGVYVHIPYCMQICPYCAFTKYEIGTTMPPDAYVEIVAREIRSRAADVPEREIETIYFGGGTPSLLEPRHILTILDELAKAGFHRRPDAEITLEINPATVDEAKLAALREIGFNRFSVGAQTFNSRLLKIAGRKHSAEDTVQLLTMLKSEGLNYSFDLLFALPTQTLEELRADVATALSFAPSHVSPYCLTVPENHPMSKGRAPDDEQVEMFALIERELEANGVMRYEISNFAKSGLESAHNKIYWTDRPYWGLGVSAHSYFPKGFSATVDSVGDWGLRFWNAPSLAAYVQQITALHESWRFARDVPDEQREILKIHQSLTDFCHTALRQTEGLAENALRLKYGEAVVAQVAGVLSNLCNEGWLAQNSRGWALTAEGLVLSNRVFEKLTFLEDELTL